MAGAALRRKLLRDAGRLGAQALAIAAVVAAGIAVLVGMISMYGSLKRSLAEYYDSYRMADVFAPLRRAPESVAAQLAAIPGVTEVQTRVVAEVVLDVRSLPEPAVGRILSLPDSGRPAVCDVYLRSGRMPEPGSDREVLASEAFALANRLGPGDSIDAVLHGRWRRLQIVGVALSPEFIYQIRPGALFPDDRRYGVFWMRRNALAAALDLLGSFNDVALRIAPRASRAQVIVSIDRTLDRWGGVGALGREQHMSARFVDNDLMQLESSGVTIPIIFLGVAAFLLNVVLTRTIGTQRAQIATLKAFGYTNAEIGWHYLQLALVVVIVGDAVGIAAGAWMGRGMARLYTDFFRFPVLDFDLSAWALGAALGVSAVAAVAGGWQAVRRVVRLPPAEAMQPEPPPLYRRTVVERLRLDRLLLPSGRMVLRNLERRPWRALLSIVAMALAGSIVVLGSGQEDAIDYLLRVQFGSVQRDDVQVVYVEPRGASASHEVRRLPGVIRAEPMRAVPATLRFAHRSEDLALIGQVRGATLRRIVDRSGRVIEPPADGLALSRRLAARLGAARGDEVTVQIKEGARPVRRLRVVELVDDMIGLWAYLELDALRRLLGEGNTSSGAYLRVDGAWTPVLYLRLKAMPGVAAVAVREATLASMRATMAKSLNQSRVIIVTFAVIITFGVIYNAARIALAERARELASLRVIGMTRGEISTILLGELAVLTVCAIPLGWLVGYGLGALVLETMTTDFFRIPMIMAPSTYAFSAAVMSIASVGSALLVRRRLDRLDLVAVLKTRE